MSEETLNTTRLGELFGLRLDQISNKLWQEKFKEMEGSEPEYHHQIATEEAWREYLASIGCSMVNDYGIRRDLENIFNEFAPKDMVCVKMPYVMEFIFVPRELAFRMLVLDHTP